MELTQSKYKVYAFVDRNRKQSSLQKYCNRYNQNQFLENKGEITPDMIRSKSRKQPLVYLRFAIINILKQKGYTHSQIGAIVKRDHSTVTYALKLATYDKDVISIIKIIQDERN